MTKVIKNFTVEGGRSAGFPLDMLRYDCAWPQGSEDCLMIAALLRGETDIIAALPAKVRIRLCTPERFNPTTARWASFHWRVVEVSS